MYLGIRQQYREYNQHDNNQELKPAFQLILKTAILVAITFIKTLDLKYHNGSRRWQFKLNATKNAGYRTDKSIICFTGALFDKSIYRTRATITRS